MSKTTREIRILEQSRSAPDLSTPKIQAQRLLDFFQFQLSAASI
jgi:hypothetical protein